MHGISDLLAQMTLESSSATQPQVLPPTVSNIGEPALVLDTPVNHKQQRKSTEDHSILSDCPSTPLSHADSAATASPSVSAVINALHLSDIDWDTLSFTSSPLPQSVANHTTEPEPSKTTAGEVKDTKRKTSSDVKNTDPRPAAELCYTECPLRDRVLIRNTAKAVKQMETHHNIISKRLNRRLAPLDNSKSQSNGQKSGKCFSDSECPVKEFAVNIKEPLTERRQFATNMAESEREGQILSKTQNKHKGSQKPPQKYTFVETAVSSAAPPPQRCPSDPGQSKKNMLQTTKKSVCVSLASSSEESDTENQQFGPQIKTKHTSMNKIKGNFLSDFPLKPVSGPKTTRATSETTDTVQVFQLKPPNCSADTERNSKSISSQGTCREQSPANVNDDVFHQNSGSPLVVSDNDDSVICSDSPLPLAERLRLRFLK